MKEDRFIAHKRGSCGMAGIDARLMLAEAWRKPKATGPRDTEL